MLARRMRRTALLLLLTVLGLYGCGAGRASRPPDASLVLDFTPNAVHAGIYEALARHYDLRSGVRLHVIVPSASTDSIRLLETGRVNFALLDIHDLAIARERGQDVIGIMALVQRPLAAVIAAPRIATPRQLAGRLVGVTGVPSDTAVLHSILAGTGTPPVRVHTITIGFDAVADLLAGRVAAATAFWNDEGVSIRRRAPGFHVFTVDRYGAPSYPELILCATATSLRAHPTLARAVVRALVLGYDQVLSEPASGDRALVTQVPGLDAGLQGAELHALLPAFAEPGGTFGALDPGRLQAWARWEQRFGIVNRPPDLATMFTRRFLPAR
jgi:putative hydroxymethylpyrimidine transport system substrate-binding protein